MIPLLLTAGRKRVVAYGRRRAGLAVMDIVSNPDGRKLPTLGTWSTALRGCDGSASIRLVTGRRLTPSFDYDATDRLRIRPEVSDTHQALSLPECTLAELSNT